MPRKDLHPYNEAGRRLKAALASYVAGHKGVDRMLKREPEDAGSDWGQLAEDLIAVLLRQSAASSSPQHPGPVRIK